MNEESLENLLNWFYDQPVCGAIPLHGAVHKVQDVLSITWFRQKQWQVQIFVVPPNYVIPEHSHPNVDSFEVYLGGQIRFSLDGKWVATEDEFTVPQANGYPQQRGKSIRVLPGALHGGHFGPGGGVFASIQHWLNGVEPHCVGSDYTGLAMGVEHAAQVVFGTATVPAGPLNALHAASEERA